MEEAVRKRISAKGWLTRVERQLREFVNKNEQELSISELNDAIDEFEKRMSILDEAQATVENLIDIASLEEDIENAASFREEKRLVYVKAKDRTLKMQVQEADVLPGPPCSESSSSGVNTRLPQLELPKFSGDYTAWQTFWEKFEACVDSTNIPNINKFTYLQSVLEGEAAVSIRGLSLTSDNYSIAKDILKKRFGRTERIIFSHIQNLMKVSSKLADGSTVSLWKIHDEIQINVRSLQNLGVGGETYGVILTPLILHQLPANIRLEWARVGEEREGDLDFLLDFLHGEIRRRERSQTFNSLSQEKQNDVRRQRPTATALLADGGNSDNRPAATRPNSWRSCAFCHNEHFSDQCHLIKNLSFDERKIKIRNAGLCFRCLRKGHLSKSCAKMCYFCKGDHNSLLCKSRIDRKRDDCEQQKKLAQTLTAASQEVQSPHQGVSYSNTGKRTTVMQVVKLKVTGVELHLLFDSGSDRSFVEASVARNLNLNQIGSEELSYSCFGEQNVRKRNQRAMKLFEFDQNGIKMQLLEIPNICSPMHRAAVPPDVLLPFENIPFTEEYGKGQNFKIDILVGLDYYWELVGQNVKTSKGLVAQETKFGWMLSGFWDNNSMTLSPQNCLSMHCRTDISEDLVRQMWDLDSIGVTGSSDRSKEELDSDNSDKISENFRRDIKMSQGRYEVKLPWKSEEHKRDLMNNENQAIKRLENLSKRLNMNQDLRDRYDAVLSDLENEGIIHEIPKTEMETDNPVFYLPHRPVVKEESASTKVRPVFDASAKGMNGISLNDCLEAGPNLLPDLVQVLIRFRKHKYAFVADIKKAFLQIKLNKIEQDVHRFLWDMNGVVRHMRFERVSFGVNSSPFLLNATIKYHLEQFDKSKIVNKLKDNLYMDDLLSGAESEAEMQQLITDADNIMSQGGFTLTKWGSNCSSMPQTVVKKLEGNLTENVPTRKILGVAWNMEEDCFCFETLNFELHTPITKRLLLSLIARIFDPLGLLTPFTITLKILFQDAWKIGVEWDQNLPLKIQKEILKWISDLRDIQKWKVPRRVIEAETWQDAKTIELISFSDASEKAYGCCIYLKTTQREPTGATSCLVISKVRVAPLKGITLPRLELMAALLSARLLKFVHSALQLEKDCPYTCYSDSQIALHWIRGDPSRWKQFVSNRVAEIQDLTDAARWKYCRSKENPADLLTRGLDAETLSNSSFWLRGPLWLVEYPDQVDGDETSDLESVIEDVSEHLKMEEKKSAITFVVNDNVNVFSKLDKFGKWERLVRVCGWMLRFIKNCRSKSLKRNRDLTEQLKPNETIDATEKIILNLQRLTYSNEFKDLQSGCVVNKKSSIYNLSPFIGKDGLLRVRGRLEFAPGLYYDEKHPIILPKCQTSSLIVQAQHEIMKHAGVNTLMAALRNKYWIVGVRTLAKKICKRCVRCQRQDSRPLDQVTAPLPRDRLTKSPPFHVTGVDHAGPLYCRDMDNKLYILIFTCAVTRAVHLELVESLSLSDFLMAFRRFSARRGLPTIMYSDNASTFKGADQYIQRHFKQAKITWKFNAPRAPWWGGWWERLIRSVKAGLKKSLGSEQVTRTELETTLQEVECCVNSRPLTYVEETKQPLTPSHFLIGRGTPFMSAEPIEFTPELLDLCSRDIAVRGAIDKFWDTWREDYIRNLPPLRLKKSNFDLKIGSVVIIKNEGKSRLLWPLGVVTKLYTGRDGYVRAVQWKTANGFIDRPVQNLYRLEVDGENGELVEDDFPSGNDENNSLSKACSQSKTENKEVRSGKGRVIKPRKDRVIHRVENGKVIFNVKLPKRGEYSLGIDGTSGKKPTPRNFANYMLVSEQRLSQIAYPMGFEDGIGKKPACDKFNIEALTYHSGLIRTQQEDIEISFKVCQGTELSLSVIGTDVMVSDSRRLVTEVRQNDLLTYRIRLPKAGTYGIKVIGKPDDLTQFQRVYDYIVEYTVPKEARIPPRAEPEGGPVLNPLGANKVRDLNSPPTISIEDTAEDETRKRIDVAIEAEDEYELAATLDELMLSGVSERGQTEIARLKHELQIISMKKDLLGAVNDRDLKELIHVITLIKENGHEHRMAKELREATKMMERLQHIQNLLHDVQTMNQKTITEIRGYSCPPPAVHRVMMATLLILWHFEEETQDWLKLQAIIGKTGRDSIKRRCEELSLDDVPLDIALGARELIKDFTLDQCRMVSSGAATFYVWVKGVIDEISKRHAEEVAHTRPRTSRSRRARRFNDL